MGFKAEPFWLWLSCFLSPVISSLPAVRRLTPGSSQTWCCVAWERFLLVWRFPSVQRHTGAATASTTRQEITHWLWGYCLACFIFSKWRWLSACSPLMCQLDAFYSLSMQSERCNHESWWEAVIFTGPHFHKLDFDINLSKLFPLAPFAQVKQFKSNWIRINQHRMEWIKLN